VSAATQAIRLMTVSMQQSDGRAHGDVDKDEDLFGRRRDGPPAAHAPKDASPTTSRAHLFPGIVGKTSVLGIFSSEQEQIFSGCPESDVGSLMDCQPRTQLADVIHEIRYLWYRRKERRKLASHLLLDGMCTEWNPHIFAASDCPANAGLRHKQIGDRQCRCKPNHRRI
jgi:hypothetical protein